MERNRGQRPATEKEGGRIQQSNLPQIPSKLSELREGGRTRSLQRRLSKVLKNTRVCPRKVPDIEAAVGGNPHTGQDQTGSEENFAITAPEGRETCINT